MDESKDEQRSRLSVVIADLAGSHRDQLARDLCARSVDVWLAEDVAAVVHLIELHRPTIVASELLLRDGTWRDVLSTCRETSTRFVMLTARGSIATAVSAIKLGAANYLIKPVSADQLISASHIDEGAALAPQPADGLSLDRAIWELLWQAIELCGSNAGAARMLQLDRRSLRRMIQKNPPRS